ncbi:DUF4112 domain-containing protein [Pseudooceanicola sp. C21-150M6]|uniref:DUF4112 domain-containing protein n=1 Tax=Pseudooceanicola sp. C21-150M6 TaxID=3434355 RepID=UPI003D7F29A9
MSPQADILRRLDRVDRVAQLMDRAVRLPGTRIRLGLDSVLGLVPGVGDTLTLLPSAFVLAEAHRLGVPRHVMGRMVGNLAVDWAIGLVPLIGDIFDVGWKANVRNAALLREHALPHALAEAPPDMKKAAPRKARPVRSDPIRS